MKNRYIKVFMLCFFMSSIFTLKAQVTPFCGDGEWVSLEPVNSFEDFEHGNWELVFEDNFDTSIDPSKWYTCFDGWNRRHGDELQYYLDKNVSVENGILKLQAIIDPDNYPVIYFDSLENAYHIEEYFEYTSGMLQSKTKFQYGLFEIRCKIPSGQGLWPAFWMFGNGGEIDIFEFNASNPQKHYMTIHTWPENNGAHESCSTNWTNNSSFADDFHTFSMEWDEYKIVFYVDGIEKRIDYKYFDILGHGLYDCFHQTTGIYRENPLFPEHAQPLIINLAIANDNNEIFGPAPNGQTPFPSTLEVDYVKVYKKKNPSKDISISSFDEKSSDYYTGKTISVTGNVSCSTIANGDIKNLIACDSVTLYPGFTAEEGGGVDVRVTQGSRMQPKMNADGKIYTIEKESQLDYLMEENYDEEGSINKITNEVKEGCQWSSVSLIGPERLVEVYPNPNMGNFQIRLNSNPRQYQCVQVVDSKGMVIYSIDHPISQILDVTTGNMVGVFFVKCMADSHAEIVKVIVE